MCIIIGDIHHFIGHCLIPLDPCLYILFFCREYRAGDTLSMQLLTSIHSHFASLLTAETSSGFLDKSPSEKFENIVRNVTSSLTLDNVVTNLISAGYILLYTAVRLFCQKLKISITAEL